MPPSRSCDGDCRNPSWRFFYSKIDELSESNKFLFPRSFHRRNAMSRSCTACLLLLSSLLLALLTGCSRDPNVRKQKYFDSGEKYFAEGKYREAAIQYMNAIQIDSRFTQAHYQMGQVYLRLGDKQRAYTELGRTVELSPNNYAAITDLANILVSAR